jgi:xanthine dehydrogenase accessory factor
VRFDVWVLVLLWGLEIGAWSFRFDSMNAGILEELLRARQTRTLCAVATVAATTGSVPRQPGSKMLVYADGKSSGTIGGGKFESLVVEDCLKSIAAKEPVLKTYPLREDKPDSFGAICGGEVTMLIEPQNLSSAIFLIGGGHCSLAIAKLALDCGMHVTVVDDRAELLENFPTLTNRVTEDANAFISKRDWKGDEALVLVSRNHELDREALAAALKTSGAGYIGMIGSRRKVLRVFDALKEQGVSDKRLSEVYAPIGLDIGADSPAEIAVSVMAEILKVLRRRRGGHLRLSDNDSS